MPSITVSNMLSGGARGMGMHIKLADDVLHQLGNMKPGDSFDLKYSLAVDGGQSVDAVLSMRLNDPHGLFVGHSMMAILGNLLTQVIAAKIE